jgi:hypothetical protein
MTKLDNITLYKALSDTKLGSLPGFKFAYAISKNLAILKTEIEALQKALEPSEEYKKYDEKRIGLAIKYSKKGENGEPKTIVNPTNPNIFEYELEDKEGFKNEFEGLREENKDVISAREAQIKEQDEFLKTESTLELYKVSLSDVPQNITVAQMQDISPIVTEDILSPISKGTL